MTMRSGTNAFHGSAYEYLANEALNAGTPSGVEHTGFRGIPEGFNSSGRPGAPCAALYGIPRADECWSFEKKTADNH